MYDRKDSKRENELSKQNVFNRVKKSISNFDEKYLQKYLIKLNHKN